MNADPMPSRPEATRYRAFLSYSHKDRSWGDWIHAALEAYRIPKELIGRQTLFGPVPAKLRPIFRDRFDLAASHALGERINAALATSDSLLVLCSRAAAKSKYVNEEIRHFKQLGKSNRILALIVDGEPHDAENECFPPALTFKVNPAGELTREPDLEPIAADAREHADGKDLAKLKIIAGLLGLGLDEIRKREAMAERRRKRAWMSIAGAMAILAVVAVLGFWLAILRTRDAERRFEIAFRAAQELVMRVDSLQDRYGVPEAVLNVMMKDAIAQLDRLTQEGGAESDAFRFLQAEAHLLASGVAKRRGDATERRERLEKAIALLSKLSDSDLENRRGWRAEFANALMQRANLLWDKNERSAAREDYQRSLAISEQLASLPTATPALHHDLANHYANIAHRTDAAGDATERLTLLQKSLSIRRGLATDFPRNSEYQRSYALGLIEVGEAMVKREQASEKEIEEGTILEGQAIDLLKTMLNANPDNSDIAQALGTAYSKHGDALVRAGHIPEALVDYRADLQLMQNLSDANPDHAMQQLDTAVSGGRVALVLANTAHVDEALKLLRDALRRERHVALRDPENSDLQERTARRLMQIADLLKKQGDPDAAVSTFRETVKLYEDLVHRLPSREDYLVQRMVQQALLGRFLASLQRVDEAIGEFRRARELATEAQANNSLADELRERTFGFVRKLDEEIVATSAKRRPNDSTASGGMPP